ncbi:hypothetical protein [Streptomyces noursei]|uniref:hypothetical protein n=1 Tax=Streptomyces noursei TaxID=1971 RepID=UPI0038296C21
MWSKGWEALLNDVVGFIRHSATDAAAWNDWSSFLWCSRDLAAWGIAHRLAFHTPNPPWATRTAKTTA